MNQTHTTRFSTRLRLLCGLALFLGLCIMLGGLARPAHAQSNLSVTDCSSDTQLQAAVSQANRDNAGDVITFACSGDIKLSSTLNITGSMTLSGSGQHVTLDSGDIRWQVISVNGAPFSSVPSLTLNALTIAHGFTDGNGGGLSNVWGTVNISNSTFAYNHGGYHGGGLYNFNGTVNISNSTFAHNVVAFGGSGGGAIRAGGRMTISNSTIAYNSADPGFGDGIILVQSDLTMSGSIVADNTGGNCFSVGTSISDQGYNLSNDSSCGFTGTGSLQNTDPKFDPSGLQDNGGPTQTMALQQGSPASDQLPLATCPASDQRGVSRPDNGESKCDMGAYEFADPVDQDLGLSRVPANLTVDATSPQGATVTYTPPTATDESGDSSTASVSCTPASGSTLAIGTTKVTCTASDSDDTNSPVSQSFTVTVKGAAAQVNDLVNQVNSDHLSSSLQSALDNKLQDVLTAITAGQTTTSCSELTDFIGHVQSQTGKGITQSQANQLVAAAKQVQAVLGC